MLKDWVGGRQASHQAKLQRGIRFFSSRSLCSFTRFSFVNALVSCLAGPLALVFDHRHFAFDSRLLSSRLAIGVCWVDLLFVCKRAARRRVESSSRRKGRRRSSCSAPRFFCSYCLFRCATNLFVFVYQLRLFEHVHLSDFFKYASICSTLCVVLRFAHARQGNFQNCRMAGR